MMMLNNNLKSNKKIKKRLLLTSLLLAIILFLIIFNLISIVLNNSKEYNQIVLSQIKSRYSTSNVESKRGDILDENGKVIATSRKVYNLIIDARLIKSEEDDRYLNATISALNDVYGYSISELSQLIEDRKNSAYVKYKKKLNFNEKEKFETYQVEKNEEYRNKNVKDRIRGVWFEEEYERYYPYKSLASNVIGYLSSQNKSMMGIELYYDDILSGTDGKSFGYLNESFNLESVQKEKIDGNNVVLTLDLDMQSIVEKYIKEWEENDVGSKEASVIIMDSETGEIKAMASNNSFDPNNPRDLSMYKKEEIFALGSEYYINEYNKSHLEQITDGDVLKAYNYDDVIKKGNELALYKNWKNNCIQNTYEPGSTVKVFTVAGALEENLVNDSSHFLCEGKIELTDGEHSWTIKCANRNGHGDLNLEESLIYSCNMSMVEMAEMLGIDKFTKYQEIFGFGQKTDIDLPYEADTSKLVYNKDNMGRTSLDTNAFGQNYNCSMIQVITAYASILNGGNLIKPHLLKRVENSKGSIIENYVNDDIRKTVSDKTSKFLEKALIDTVEVGTGKTAKIKDIIVGGKTGTAEKLPRANQNYLVSFCGFIEKGDKKLLCYVVIDEPKLKGEAQARSSYACKLFKNIMTDVYNDVKMIKEETNDEELVKLGIATTSNAININFNNDTKNNKNIKNTNTSDEEFVPLKNKKEDISTLPAMMPNDGG